MATKHQQALWTAAVVELGLAHSDGDRFEGTIDGYRVWLGGNARTSRESTMKSTWTQIQVHVPGLPDGLIISRRRAIMRRLAIFGRDHVTVNDRSWDNAYAVRADDHDAVIAWLNGRRRAAIQEVTIRWTLVDGWIKTTVYETSPGPILTGVRRALALASALDG